VNKRPLKNVAASVHHRLLNIAKNTARPFDEVLQYFAMERCCLIMRSLTGNGPRPARGASITNFGYVVARG
jgi:hypothetical protein